MLVSLPTDISQMQPNTAQVVTPFGHNLLRFIHLIHQDRQVRVRLALPHVTAVHATASR